MAISKISNLYTNKHVLRGLEYVSEHSALVTSGTTLLMSMVVRPISILKTPKAKKEDKEFACAKSISSAIVGFGLTSFIFHPISKAVCNIEKEPNKFLNEKTIKNLSDGVFNITQSKPFNKIKQGVKISPEILSILPKAMLTTILVAPLVNKIFKKNEKQPDIKPQFKKSNLVPTKNISFMGNKINRLVASVFNNKKVQNFAMKNPDSSLIRNTLYLKDIIATGTFCAMTKLNPKIKEENKNPLINNSIISTGLTILGAGAVDKLTEKPFEKLITNFKNANKNSLKLNKYVNGLKIIKPIVILSGIYYALIPSLSTYLSEKIRQKKEA